MRTKRWLLVALVASGPACSEMGDDVDGFSSEQWSQIKALEPLAGPMPHNPFNKRDTDQQLARLGQMLFFETDLAEPIMVDGPSGKVGERGKVGCVNCHDPKHYFIDTRPGPDGSRPASVSHSRTWGKRNAPAMLNVGWYDWIGWTGRNDSLVMHGAGVMGLSATVLSYAHYLFHKYRKEWDAVFPDAPLDPALDPDAPDAARFPPTGAPKTDPMAPDGPWEKMAPEDQKIIQRLQSNLGRLFDAYPRMLTTRSSAFGRYVAGEYGALGPAAKRGLRLFTGKAACNDCHNGPLLSDNKFHNVGVPDSMASPTMDAGRFPDLGAARVSPFSGVGPFSDDPAAGRQKQLGVDMTDEKMKGAFRTPSLLNVAETGPYFHTGLYKSLAEVVHHYNQGGGAPGSFSGVKDPRLLPLGLSDGDCSDLVEFLKSLTGAPPDEEWTRDTAKH